MHLLEQKLENIRLVGHCWAHTRVILRTQSPWWVYARAQTGDAFARSAGWGGSLLEPRAEFWAKCLALRVGPLTWGFQFRPFSAP